MKSTRFLWPLIMLCSLLLGCSSGSNDESENTEARFINLVAGTESVVFEFDEETEATIDFRHVSSVRSVSGVVDVDVEVLDGDGDATTIINDQTQTFNGEQQFVIMATGDTLAAELMTFTTPLEEPESDITLLQFANATGDAVTIRLLSELNSEDVLMTATLDTLAAGTQQEILSQSVRFQVERADGTVMLLSNVYELDNEMSILVVVTDYEGPINPDLSVDLLIVGDALETEEIVGPDESASVRYISAITNLPDASISISSDGISTLDTSVPFAQSTERISTDPGLHNLSIASAANEDSSVFNTSFSLIGGFDYTYLLSGDIGAVEGILIIDDVREVVTAVQFVLIHAAQALESVDIYISDDINNPLSGQLFSDVPYRNSRVYSAEGDTYSITVTSPDSTSILSGPFLLQVDDGDIVNFLLHEDSSSGAPFGLTRF